jgi:uncharacterized repeat protein (TIGR03803 family)
VAVLTPTYRPGEEHRRGGITAILVLAVAASTNVHAQTYSVLFNFHNSGGGTTGTNAGPAFPRVVAQGRGSDGDFYGTTLRGAPGPSNSGTVFKITSTGAITYIYNFDNTHGAAPIGPVIQGSDGDFYGTTSAGGASGFGVVFKLTSSGELTVLHSFNGTDGKTPNAGLVQANNGVFYGAASAGGRRSRSSSSRAKDPSKDAGSRPHTQGNTGQRSQRKESPSGNRVCTRCGQAGKMEDPE